MSREIEAKNKGPKACVTCAKAKSRCIPGPDGQDKCERCHRLHKHCEQQTPAPPRAKREPKPTKVAELEKRLNQLTSQLGSGTSQAAPAAAAAAAASSSVVGPPKKRPRHSFRYQYLFPSMTWPENHDGDRDGDCDGTQTPSPESGAESSSVVPTPSSWSNNSGGGGHGHGQKSARPWESLWPLDGEAQALLDEYRAILAELFPFVVVPPNMNALELKQQRPFLWKAVMMTACHMDGSRQLILGDELLRDVSAAGFHKPVRNFDLLQAIELLVAWFHVNLNSFQLTNLLYLARSMCVNFGFKDSQPYMTKNEHSSVCLEQIRAFAGTYYLNTLIFTTNKRPDCMMSTAYLDACCSVLESKMEYASDDLLVKLVRIQKITQSICMTLGTDPFRLQTLQLPVKIVVQTFQQQLDSFRSSLSPSMRGNATIVSHIATAEILLYEVGLADVQLTTHLITLSDRIEFLWGCLNAAKTFLDIRFANSYTSKPRFICLSASDFLFAFIISLRLVNLGLPGWDLDLVRTHINFSDIIERQLLDLESIVRMRRRGKFYGPDPPQALPEQQQRTDPFERLAQMLRCLKGYLLSELDHREPQTLPEDNPLPPDETRALVSDLDTAFWKDLMAQPPWSAFENPSNIDWMAFIDQ